MKSFVVDASVAIKWFVLEEHTVESRLLLDENFELFTPHLLFAEYGNIVWKKFTRGELTRDEVVDRGDSLAVRSTSRSARTAAVQPRHRIGLSVEASGLRLFLPRLGGLAWNCCRDGRSEVRQQSR